MIEVTEPGVYDMPADVYHADPVPGGSLSHSGAKRLLPPSCPALFKHWRDHGQAPSKTFDLGHAAHKVALGAGPPLVVVDAPDWRTKAAREQRGAAYAEGKVPLLTADYARVVAMSKALREHPFAGALFQPGSGRPEQALFWRDGDVMRRALVDWLPHTTGSRLIIPDYKTTTSASPDELDRTIHKYAYHSQGDWYLDGARATGLADDAAFVLVFQEKDPPYLVTVVEPDTTALRIGRLRNREAIQLYAQCVAADHWPSYSDDVELIGLPPYIENRYAEELIG